MDQEQEKPKSKKRFFSIPFLFVALIFPLCIVLFAATFSQLLDDLPSTHQLENYTPDLSTKIYDMNNNLIAELFVEKRAFATIKNMPRSLQDAFIAIEDNGFYSHWGISTKGTLRALSRVVLKGRLAEGGSTITQQLARTMFLTHKKSITRKLKEAILTLQLENIYSKDEIMQFYANQIYFGSGAYGVQAAALTYFNKDVTDLNIAESATLAAIPKSPNYYNPFRNQKASLARRNLVLSRMRELNLINKEEYEEALETPLPVKGDALTKASGKYFVEYLRIMLGPKYGNDALYKAGFSIYTTLDIQTQNAAEEVIETALAEFDEKRLKFFEDKKQEPVKVQGALIALDAKTGAIRAMVGGRDFQETQFNRATQARRQAGSSFKPFVYLAGIEAGLTPATLLNDEPMVFLNRSNKWDLVARDVTELENIAERVSEDELIDTNRIWSPVNYNKKFRGHVTLRTALALSINTCAVEVIIRVTPSSVVEVAQRLGITTPLLDAIALALGSSDVILQDMVGAYAVFASGGIKAEPYVITRIVDRDGRVLEEHVPEYEEVISPQVSFVMTNMLRSVVERGSGWSAKELKRPAAGKTGTTNEFSDAWFIGFTPNLVAGVWVGYDDRSISLGEGSSGGVVAAPIWTEFMKLALVGKPVLEFTQPSNIEWAFIDPRTGLLALSGTSGGYLEAFIMGTAPTMYYRRNSRSEDIEVVDDLTEEAGF